MGTTLAPCHNVIKFKLVSALAALTIHTQILATASGATKYYSFGLLC
jgi:hypothetical protein